MTELFISTISYIVCNYSVNYEIIAALPSWYGDEVAKLFRKLSSGKLE